MVYYKSQEYEDVVDGSEGRRVLSPFEGNESFYVLTNNHPCHVLLLLGHFYSHHYLFSERQILQNFSLEAT